MSKFNPDLIQKARKGEIAILNDGSKEDLFAVIEEVDLSAIHNFVVGAKYVYLSQTKNGWQGLRICNMPHHSVKEFFMPDTTTDPKSYLTEITKPQNPPRTYKVTRGQMKEIWEAIEPAYQEYFIDVMKGRFGHFNNEGELYQGDVESLCEAAPKELLQKIFPEYFYIPEGEAVLCRDNLGSWVIGVSDGKGKAYVTFNYNHAQSYGQIIPFTKNPPQ